MGISGLKEVAPARPAGAKPSASPAWARDGDLGVPTTLDDGVTDLGKCWRNSVKKFADSPCLGKREGTGPYTFETYAQIGKKVDAMGAALTGRGVQPKSAVGVYGANCPQWMVAMQACNRQNLMCVPLYDTLGVTAVEFILKHSDAASVFVEGAKLATLASALPSVKDQLKLVVYWGEATSEAQEAVKALGIDLASFDELLEAGTNNPVPHVECDPEDLCTIMYTSGTTGDPKGVMIKHSNVLAEIKAASAFTSNTLGQGVGPNDVFLSYLPLAHIFDRAVEEYFLTVGGCVGYWRGDIKYLLEDIAELRPTFFAGVPRVFDRIYAGVMTKMKAAGFIKHSLFNFAFSRKKAFMAQGLKQDEASPFFDKLVFSKLKQALGGRVKLIISGAAPLSPHVMEFLQVCMMCTVTQGYGLTETMAGSTISVPGSKGANVGPPLPGVQIRLESVPDMNYDALADPPRGEILIGGDTVFSGYFKREDITKEVLESDGWFHTGDVGEIGKDGNLRIIDRVKNIFKLSQGEYVAVEKVEGELKKFEMLEQLWVYGNSFENCLVAVVVPVEAKMMAWAKSHHIKGDFKEVCATPQAKKMLLEGLTTTGKEAKLKGFEMVKDLLVETSPFDVEKGLLTPTFKMKRPQLQKHYQKEIDAMYAAMKKK
mmetsp:Transcript_21388/g.53882  ORF Transcript_21388/g.53882 Transcript_21388/m.53882 type:complete len:655 (+) Transcript_21388:111-2075(+)|eukprot:jgi/Tetstr1/435832/TSEL_024720.t1